jgi:hypothetical protein
MIRSWFGLLLCRLGYHDDGERISAMHPYDHCLRCGKELS